jgi:hypothetical protein
MILNIVITLRFTGAEQNEILNKDEIIEEEYNDLYSRLLKHQFW